MAAPCPGSAAFLLVGVGIADRRLAAVRVVRGLGLAALAALVLAARAVAALVPSG
ncbi:MAG TPA: hypothetical protein VE085_10800 [Burkholderiales bacterium]|nr:hypothetical protein [Burkholderiales bacterium]